MVYIDKRGVGKRVYNSANASLYRSVRRLEERGLIQRLATREQLVLTASGLVAAQKLAGLPD
jgi:predicted transcriptional regulator